MYARACELLIRVTLCFPLIHPFICPFVDVIAICILQRVRLLFTYDQSRAENDSEDLPQIVLCERSDLKDSCGNIH